MFKVLCGVHATKKYVANEKHYDDSYLCISIALWENGNQCLAIMFNVLPVTLTVIHVFPFPVVLATDLNVNLARAEVMSRMTSQTNRRINERGIRLLDDRCVVHVGQW